MRCANCGIVVHEDSNFCKNCGHCQKSIDVIVNNEGYGDVLNDEDDIPTAILPRMPQYKQAPPHIEPYDGRRHNPYPLRHVVIERRIERGYDNSKTKNLLSWLVTGLLIVIMVITNPTKEDFANWAGNYIQERVDNPVGSIASSLLGELVIKNIISHENYGILSVFKLDNQMFLGVFKQFIPIGTNGQSQWLDDMMKPQPTSTPTPTLTPKPTLTAKSVEILWIDMHDMGGAYLIEYRIKNTTSKNISRIELKGYFMNDSGDIVMSKPGYVYDLPSGQEKEGSVFIESRARYPKYGVSIESID